MTNRRHAGRVAVLAMLVLTSAFAHSATFRVGDTVTCQLSLESPMLSLEFTPVVGGTLRVDLEPVLHTPPMLAQQWSPASVQLVVFRGGPNAEPQPLVAGRLEEETGLTLYFRATAGVPHRALLSLSESSEQATCQLTLRGTNMGGSTLLVRDETETRLLAAATRHELASWVSPVTQTQTITFSPGGDQLLTGQGSSLSLTGTFTGQPLGTASLPPGSEAEFRFVPDVPRLLPACVTGTNTLALLSTPDLSEIATFPGTHTLLSPRADRFIVYGASTTLIADTESGAVVAEWEGATQATEALLSPDGRTVAFWEAGPAQSQSGQLYETTNGQPLGDPLQFAVLEEVLFSPGGGRLLWIGISPTEEERVALLQSTTDGTLIQEEGLMLFTQSEPLQTYLGPMSRRLVLTPAGEPVIPWVSLYDCNTGVLLRSYIGFGQVSAVRFHPFGKTLLVVGAGESEDELEVKFLDAEQGSQLQQYNPRAFQYAEYDPTGRRLALVGRWKLTDLTEPEVIRIVNGLDGTQLGEPHNADDWLDPLFSPDGERLVAHSLGRSWPDPISQVITWETAGGSQVSSNRSVGENQAKGISADSTRYYYLARLSSGVQVLSLINLTNGLRVGSSLHLTKTADPLLNFSGTDLFYVAHGEGDSVGHIGRVRLANGQAQRGASIAYTAPERLCWSGDGKRLLFDYTSDAGERRSALIDAFLLTVLEDYSAEGGAEFDATVRPRFLSFDFTGDGDVNVWDLFELQLTLDPDYPEVLHDFIRASDWR